MGRRPTALVAAGAYRLVFVFIAARHYGQAEKSARTAADALRPMAEEGNPQAMSLWGGLTLQRAVIAARVNDADSAYSQFDQAGRIAGESGEGRAHAPAPTGHRDSDGPA